MSTWPFCLLPACCTLTHSWTHSLSLCVCVGSARYSLTGAGNGNKNENSMTTDKVVGKKRANKNKMQQQHNSHQELRISTSNFSISYVRRIDEETRNTCVCCRCVAIAISPVCRSEFIPCTYMWLVSVVVFSESWKKKNKKKTKEERKKQKINEKTTALSTAKSSHRISSWCLFGNWVCARPKNSPRTHTNKRTE